MSIATELNKTIADVAAAYRCAEKAGASIPVQKNLDNLAPAIASIDSAVLSGVPPFELKSVSNYPVRDYRIYGQSLQDGTPSAGNPVEVLSVGDLISEGENAGKYAIPVAVSGMEETARTEIILDEPLRKIGELCDYIDYRRQVVVRRVGEVVYDGQESWSDLSMYVGAEYFSAYHLQNDKALGVMNVLSDKFQVVPSGQSSADSVMNGRPGNKAIAFTISRTQYGTIGTVAEWKAWLANNNVRVFYELENTIEQSVLLPAVERMVGEVTLSVGTSVEPSGVWVKV